MEIRQIIEFLTQQRAMVDETISCLEKLNAGVVPQVAGVPAKRRGRKFMDAADRQKVSERMKQYWDSRRPPKPGRAGDAA